MQGRYRGYIAAQGAKLDKLNQTGSGAYSQAYYGNNIDFFTLTDTIEMKVGKQKLLRLSADIDNNSNLQLVWNPKRKGLIGCYDVEHQAYADLCNFTAFFAKPEMYLIKFLEGEL